MGTPEINHDGELFTSEAGEGDTTIPVNDILDDPELPENQVTGSPYTAVMGTPEINHASDGTNYTCFA